MSPGWRFKPIRGLAIDFLSRVHSKNSNFPISVILFREQVGPRRWMALIVGFTAILIIVNPTAELHDPTVFLAFYAALSYSVVVMITRRIG